MNPTVREILTQAGLTEEEQFDIVRSAAVAIQAAIYGKPSPCKHDSFVTTKGPVGETAVEDIVWICQECQAELHWDDLPDELMDSIVNGNATVFPFCADKKPRRANRSKRKATRSSSKKKPRPRRL